MEIAKLHIDVGLFAREISPHLTFWKDTVGLQYDHMAKLGAGIHQHRFHMNGSVLKINHSRHPLAESSPSGITALRIATVGLGAPLQISDPDGNRVSLVPEGQDGLTGIGIDLRVNNRDAHDRFWRHVMQFTCPSPGVYVCGDSRILICEEGSVDRAESWRGYGWRYLTVQVTNCQAEHKGVLQRGGSEGEPPRRMGDVAMISFVRDPDGNFIELSQRASLVGSLY
jgi:lactoylglutathione lyase